MSPLLLLSFALQIACCVHVVRTGRPLYWVFILLLFSFLAVIIYFIAEILPELVKRGVRPDCVTDQTSAHDPVHGYLPAGWTVAEWLAAQQADADLQQQRQAKAQAQHRQQVAVGRNQHLVHHPLHEERGQDHEHLQGQRQRQDLAQRRPQAANGAGQLASRY